MSFSITILGSGSAVPTSSRNPSAQYVECNGRFFLIDCGEGTQMRMRQHGLKFQRVDHVLISHLHGDHYFGLVGLLSTMHMMGRVRPIYIHAPIGLKKIVELQLEAGGARLSFDINVIELEPNSNGVLFEDDKVKVLYFPLLHKIPTNGFLIQQKPKDHKLLVEKARKDGIKIEYYHRLKKGENITTDDGEEIAFKDYTEPAEPPKTYAYCSDTHYSEAIIEYIEGADVLYHEATFTEELMDRAIATKHSTAKQAGKIAQKAQVGKLLMGHLSARYEDGSRHEEEAKEFFENCVYVNDGDKFVIE